MRAGIVLLLLSGGLGCMVDDGDWGDRRVRPGDPASGFTVTWKLVDATAGTADPTAAPALDCSAAAVTTVRLDTLNQSTGERFTFHFPCAAQNGITTGVSVGSYLVTVDALGADGGSRSRDSWELWNGLDVPQPTDLGLVIFLVDL
jgi:hypothetical protein